MSRTTRLLLLWGLSLCMAGCGKEPMIHLSDEVRTSIEQKENKDKQEDNGANADLTDVLSSEESQIEELPKFQEVDFRLGKEFSGEALELKNYFPTPADTLKTYLMDGEKVTVYPDLIQEDQSREILSYTYEDAFESKLYQWNWNQYLEAGLATHSYPSNDTLTSYDQSVVYTLLEGPLMKGTTWISSDGVTSEITGIYETATINDASYEEIIEVTTSLSEGTLKQFYALDVGLIYESLEDDMLTALLNLEEDQTNHQALTIYEWIDQNEFEEFEETFEWKTNDSQPFILEELFKILGWISEDVMIHTLLIDESQDLLTIDFNYLFSEDIKSHPQGEFFVIASMVQTLTDYFQLSHVAITMNGAPVVLPGLQTEVGGWTQATNWGGSMDALDDLGLEDIRSESQLN